MGLKEMPVLGEFYLAYLCIDFLCVSERDGEIERSCDVHRQPSGVETAAVEITSAPLSSIAAFQFATHLEKNEENYNKPHWMTGEIF